MRDLFFAVSVSMLLAGCGGSHSQKPVVTPSSSMSSSSSVLSTSTSISTFTSTSSSSSLAPSVIAKKIDDYLAANQPANQPGISIVIIKNGEQVYSGGKGMADIPSGVAIASNTGFRLASVSKPFTAIAVMQLVERGELKLTDSLLDYIPELPEAWRSITIDHLLAHRSGIYDIFNDYLSPTLVNGMDHTKLINYFITNPKLEFETGTRTDYSNTGYMLLATVIERKTGLSFPMYMQQNIFGPANMSGSYINDISQAIKYGDALNYGRLRTYYGITTNLKGSMAQVSSRDDFVHFFDALRNNTLVSAQTLADMWRSRGNLAGTPVGFGYGFAIIDDTVGHGGDWDGFQTEMTFIPSKGVAFAILTNGGSVGRSRLHDIRNIIVTTEF